MVRLPTTPKPLNQIPIMFLLGVTEGLCGARKGTVIEMLIESRYWKEDLLRYAKKFSPKRNPSRCTERLLMHFEKDIIISMFMIRMLAEQHKFSSKTTKLGIEVFRSPCIKKVHFLNQHRIKDLYDFKKEERVTKGAIFISNQLIHSGAMSAYRDNSRNWDGIYSSFDYERQKYIYRFPLSEIVKILKTAGNDYPRDFKARYCHQKENYIIKTN